MAKKKYQKKFYGDEEELGKNVMNYDVMVSQGELVKMFDLEWIKFENHLELAKKENKMNSSLTGLYSSFMKIFKSIEKLT